MKDILLCQHRKSSHGDEKGPVIRETSPFKPRKSAKFKEPVVRVTPQRQRRKSSHAESDEDEPVIRETPLSKPCKGARPLRRASH